jgi:hypothetical protein
MKYHILFETHATSIDNEKGIASGHLDSFYQKKEDPKLKILVFDMKT